MIYHTILLLAATAVRASGNCGGGAGQDPCVITVTTYSTTAGCTTSSAPQNYIATQGVVATSCTMISAGLYTKADADSCKYTVYNDIACSNPIWDTDGVPDPTTGVASMPTPVIGSYPLSDGGCFRGTNPTDMPQIMHCGTEQYRTCPPDVDTALAAGTCVTGMCPANLVASICASATCKAYLETVGVGAGKPSTYCDAANPCFPSNAIVTKPDGSHARIDSLKPGDSVLALSTDGAVKSDEVSILSIADAATPYAFVSLVTEANAKLNLTSEHHLAVGAKCCSTLKKAKDVVVGDMVWIMSNSRPLPVAQKVASISSVSDVGLHSPVLTHGGLPVVNGFVTAFDSIEVVKTAEAGLPAMLKLCEATGTCDTVKTMFKAAGSLRRTRVG